MNTTETAATTMPRAGSICVYQRLIEGKMPGKVQVLRATYASTKGADGKTYGRTNNKPLASIPSGTACLPLKVELALGMQGLSPAELLYVNKRLDELARAARGLEFSVKLAAATASIKLAVAVGTDVDGARPFVLKSLSKAHKELDEHSELGAVSVIQSISSPLEMVESVLESATRELRAEATRLQNSGLTLTNQRSVKTTANLGANALDVLQARANNIRCNLLKAFEAECKDAGLMVKKSG